MDSIIVTALELFVVFSGRAALWLLSFGRWGNEPLGGNEVRFHRAAGGLSFIHGGRRIVTYPGQLLAGMLLYAIVTILALLYAVAL